MDGEKNPIRSRIIVLGVIGAAGLSAAMIASAAPPQKGVDAEIARYAHMMLAEGTKTFRYDTLGSEIFWGDALQLPKAIAGEKNGGFGLDVSPKTATSVGLDVDTDALPNTLKKEIKAGMVNFDDSEAMIAQRHRRESAWSVEDRGEHRALLIMSGPITCRLYVFHPVFRALAVVSGLDDVVKVRQTVQQRAGDLGIGKNTWKFIGDDFGCHEDGDALVDGRSG